MTINTDDQVRMGIEKVKSLASKRQREENNYEASDFKTISNETVPESAEDQNEEVLMIPDNMAGIVIGKGGETLRTIQQCTRARIRVSDSTGSTERKVFISGSVEAISGARRQILSYIGVSDDEAEVLVPAKKIGLIVGTKASTLKEIQQRTGCKLRIPKADEVDSSCDERPIYLAGTEKSIEFARKMILDIVNSNQGASAILNSQINTNDNYIRRRDDFPDERRHFHSEEKSFEKPRQYSEPSRHFFDKRDFPQPEDIRSLKISVDVPKDYAKVIIGKGGDNISYLKRETSCKIFVEQNETQIAKVHITGPLDMILRAQDLMNDMLLRNALKPVELVHPEEFSPKYENKKPRHDYEHYDNYSDDRYFQSSSSRNFKPASNRSRSPPPLRYEVPQDYNHRSALRHEYDYRPQEYIPPNSNYRMREYHHEFVEQMHPEFDVPVEFRSRNPTRDRPYYDQKPKDFAPSRPREFVKNERTDYYNEMRHDRPSTSKQYGEKNISKQIYNNNPYPPPAPPPSSRQYPKEFEHESNGRRNTSRSSVDYKRKSERPSNW